MEMSWNGDMKFMYLRLHTYKNAFTDIREFSISEAVFFPDPDIVA